MKRKKKKVLGVGMYGCYIFILSFYIKKSVMVNLWTLLLYSGVEVKPGEPLNIEPSEEGMLIHLSQVNFCFVMLHWSDCIPFFLPFKIVCVLTSQNCLNAFILLYF